MPATVTNSQGRDKRWLYIVLLAVGVLFFGFVTLVSYGRVTGEELSPATLRKRSFWYIEIPIIHVQISPIFRDVSDFPATNYISALPAVNTRPSKNAGWDLVRYSSSERVEGDAAILARYLSLKDEEDKTVWVEWSKKSIYLAQVLWPRVLKLADDGMYIYIPDLMELAKQAKSADALERDLDAQMAKSYLKTAESLMAQERYELGVKLLSKPIEGAKRPSSDLLNKRAEFYEQLGDDENAAKDREAAKTAS